MVAALLLLAACGEPAPTPERSVVMAGEHPLDLLPEAALIHEFAIGGTGDSFRFERRAVPRVVILGDGSLIGDINTLEGPSGVAHIAPEGEVLSWVASAEDGHTFVFPPRALTQRGWYGFGMAGDTVWFLSADRSRLILRTLEGEELGRRDAPLGLRELLEARALPGEAEAGLLTGGRAYLDFLPADGPGGRPMAAEIGLLLEERGATGVDTVFFADDFRGGIGSVGFEPFGEPPVHSVAPTGDRIAIVDWEADRPADLSIRVFHLPSGELRRYEVPLPHLQLPDSVRARVVEAGVHVLDRVITTEERQMGRVPETSFGPMERGPEFLKRIIRFPEYMPAVRRVLVGLDGTVWLQRNEITPLYLYQSARPDGGARGWVALDSEGVPVFRITIPDGHLLRAARRGVIWTYDWANGTGLNRWSVSPNRSDRLAGEDREPHD